MKYYLPLLIAVLFFSCKKSHYNNYQAGSEKRMCISAHDFTIQGSYLDGVNKPFAAIDLNGDGEDDVKFLSYADSLDVWPGYVSGVNLEIINPLFDVLEIPNSGNKYYTETPYEMVWDPPFGAIERNLTTGCSTDGLLLAEESANNPKTYSECAGFIPEELDWSSSDFGALELIHSGYKYTVYHFNETEDGFLADNIIHEPSCYPIPSDENTYLMFRKAETEDCYSIGWIEVLLTDDNKLEIKRSAISNKLIKY